MEKLKHIKIINDKELSDIINDTEIYYTININGISLDLSEIELLLDRCDSLLIKKCTISNINNITLTLGVIHLCIVRSTFNIKKDLSIKTKKKTLSNLMILNCDFNESRISIDDSNFIFLDIYGCTSISGIYIYRSLFDTLSIMKLDTDNILMYSVNAFDLDMSIVKAEVSFSRCRILDATIGSDCIIKHIKSSSVILKGGLLGKELEFDIYGYKKVHDKDGNDVILYLKIQKGSKIRHSHNGKCRADKVLPIKVMDLQGNVLNDNNCKYYPILYNDDNSFYYQLNKEICSDSFNESISQCSNGIHFFMNIDDAINF